MVADVIFNNDSTRDDLKAQFLRWLEPIIENVDRSQD